MGHMSSSLLVKKEKNKKLRSNRRLRIATMRTSREQSRASHIERRKTKSSKSSSKSSPSPQSSSRASPSPQIPSPNLLKLLRILFLNPLEIHKILFQILSKSSKSSSKSSNPRCCKKEKVKKSRLKPETVDRLYSTT